eukprot:TRINITY_DN280458_c1_g1_i1.p1 TRINITY_DN280458_c1_g1~~TRINITY_DN280458_c1_g1_i1.p1  ORF type:complete len:110 (-),score=12.37 TRINITY_DN280458_c1_g1_i1:144-473(-)
MNRLGLLRKRRPIRRVPEREFRAAKRIQAFWRRHKLIAAINIYLTRMKPIDMNLLREHFKTFAKDVCKDENVSIVEALDQTIEKWFEYDISSNLPQVSMDSRCMCTPVE